MKSRKLEGFDQGTEGNKKMFAQNRIKNGIRIKRLLAFNSSLFFLLSFSISIGVFFYNGNPRWFMNLLFL